MPILLWYFPYIIMSGICDLVFSTPKDQFGQSGFDSSRGRDPSRGNHPLMR
jgi:hypothetical protein